MSSDEMSPDLRVIEAAPWRLECAPAHGAVITSLRLEGDELLWRRTGSTIRDLGIGSVGPAGDPSTKTFDDVFIGGWFVMVPAAGLPDSAQSVHTHGVGCRQRWDVVDHNDTSLELRATFTEHRFVAHRSITLQGDTVRVETTIHTDEDELDYTFGEHPCFARTAFAGGTIDLIPKSVEVLQALDPVASLLVPGEVDWPSATTTSGNALSLAMIPVQADGRHDHVRIGCPGTLRLRRVNSRSIRLESDLPELLFWQNYSAHGATFGPNTDVFALEPMTYPGRSWDDAVRTSSVRTLEPGGSATFSVAVTAEG